MTRVFTGRKGISLLFGQKRGPQQTIFSFRKELMRNDILENNIMIDEGMSVLVIDDSPLIVKFTIEFF